MFPDPSQVFIANEIRELERLGCSIRIFSYRRPKGPAMHRVFSEIHSPVTYIPEPPWQRPIGLASASAEGILHNPGHYGRTLAYVVAQTLRNRSLHTWLRFFQATIVAHHARRAGVAHLHAHFADGTTRIAMLASSLTGMRYSFTTHARDVFRSGVNRELLRQKITRAAFVIGVCEYNKRFLDEQVRHNVNGRVRVVYNGVDLKRFHPDAAVDREPDLVLAVGRLVPKKGFGDLIAACRLLADSGRLVRCRIVGDGPLRSELERAATGLNIEFTGPLSQEDLTAEYRRASVVVLPAAVPADGNSDALPTVLLEAQASGCPVVSTRVAGIPEIVDHEQNGLLVDPGDIEGLASAIDRLVSNKQVRTRLGENARRKAEERFDVAKNAAALYREFASAARVDTAR